MRSSTLLMVLALIPFCLLEAGHAPPPPDPAPPPDNLNSQQPDFQVPPGTPEYEFLVMHRYVHERLASTGYEISGGDDEEQENFPWHSLRKDAKWSTFTFPMTKEKWSDASRILVEDYYKAPTAEKLAKIKERGLSMVRVIESTAVPENVTKAFDKRQDMLAAFAGLHLQSHWVDLLTHRESKFRQLGLKFILAEKGKKPLFPLLEWYFDDLENQGNKEVTSYLEEVIGKDVVKKIKKDMQALSRVRGKNLVIKLKEKSLHPWAKAFRLDEIETMSLEDIRKKGVKVYEKTQKQIKELFESATGTDPILDLYVEFKKLELGEEVDFKVFTDRAISGDWGMRRHIALKSRQVHPDHVDKLIPLLLNLQRDRIRDVRVVANRTLNLLFLKGPVYTEQSEVGRDSLVVREWEKWAEQRALLKPDQDDKPIVIQLKQDQRNVYGALGPATHKVLEGQFEKTKITIVDHNDNDRFIDYGVDNFVVGDVLKPGQFLSRLAEVKGEWFHVELDEIYNKLTLRPYRGELGKITIKTQYEKPFSMPFIILSMGSDSTITLFNSNKGFENHLVPAGEYSIYSSIIWDDRGPTTRVNQVHIGPGERRPIFVKKDEPLLIELGGAIDMRIEGSLLVKKGATKKTPRWLKLEEPTLFGSHGENYYNQSYQYRVQYSKSRKIKVKAFEKDDAPKPFGLWDWHMTSPGEFQFEYMPWIKKMIGKDHLVVSLGANPGFAIEMKDFKMPLKLKEVDEDLLKQLLDTSPDNADTATTGGGLGGGGGGGEGPPR